MFAEIALQIKNFLELPYLECKLRLLEKPLQERDQSFLRDRGRLLLATIPGPQPMYEDIIAPHPTPNPHLSSIFYPVNQPEKIDLSDSFLLTTELAYKTVIYFQIGQMNIN